MFVSSGKDLMTERFQDKYPVSEDEELIPNVYTHMTNNNVFQ